MDGGFASIQLNGHALYLNPDDQRGRRLLQSGQPVSPVAQALWREVLALADWDLIVDIGANYGEMLLEIADQFDGRIVAFEANPALLPYLRATLAYRHNVTIEAMAVCEKVGTAPLNIDADWSGASSLALPRTAGSGNRITALQVPTTMLDAYFAGSAARRACIKIDVEGVEPFVLLGAQGFLAGLHSYAIMIEIRHATPAVLQALTRHWRVYLRELATGRWVAVDETSIVTRPDGVHEDDAVLLPLGGP